MSTDVQDPMIYKAISSIMSELKAVGKNRQNKQQGFMFRGIDDVMNAINPALSKNKVFIVPEILEQTREERKSQKGANLIYSVCKIKYTFFAEDGSNVQAIVVGEGMDSGDKATNKAMAIAFKYACFQVFCIPTEEMSDPDSEVHNVKPKQEPQAASEDKISSKQFNDISQELLRTGVPEKTILGMFKVNKVSDFTQKQYDLCMNKFKKTPDKLQPAPETFDPQVPDEMPEELPFE